MDKLEQVLALGKGFFNANKKIFLTFIFLFFISLIFNLILNTQQNNKKGNEYVLSELMSDDYTLIENDSIIYNLFNYDNLQNPIKLKTSVNGKNFIKQHEGLRLTAYTLNDNMVTIGYGHAERLKKSKYKKGHKITLHEANILFEKDIKIREQGVKRIFHQWQKEGVYVYITQNMFDSMVSMAYNMGLNGLRQSDVIKFLKEKQYINAADEITSTRISDKYPGLYKRRLMEKDLFLKDYHIGVEMKKGS